MDDDVRKIVKVIYVAKNINNAHDSRMTTGDKLSDLVAKWGGSWKFIIAAGIILSIWTVANGFLLGQETFDPYPFVFLNLILSMLAALQAPIIMMSQNRQSEKDRIAAEVDYEINRRAEEEICRLHDKLDNEVVGLREKIDKLLKSYQDKVDTI